MPRAHSDANQVQLLCLDVDGVMTDGSIVLDDEGVESKRFHVRDGTGIKIWMRLGYQVAFITGRRGEAVRHRARELGVTHLVQGSQDKLADFQTLLGELELTAAHAAMLGDDLPDLPIMLEAGYPMAVADAVAEVRQAAAFVTKSAGGHGAVREAIEHLLGVKRQWDQAVMLFTPDHARAALPDDAT